MVARQDGHRQHELPGFAVRVLTGPHRHGNPVEDEVVAEQNDRYPADPPLDCAVLVKVLVDGTVGPG